MQDAEANQLLLDIAAQANASEGIRQGLEDGKKGRARQARSPGNAAARPCHTSLGLPSALRDLEATYEFIEADSSESAAAWFNKLPEAVYSLQQYPLATK